MSNLTPETLHALANTFAEKCARKVSADPRYAEMMMEVLPEVVTELTGLGEVDDVVELSMLINDRLGLRVFSISPINQ